MLLLLPENLYLSANKLIKAGKGKCHEQGIYNCKTASAILDCSLIL